MKFSGFMNVYQLEDMSWEYQFGDKSLKANTLMELEVLVSLYGLKWSKIDVEPPRPKRGRGFLDFFT